MSIIIKLWTYLKWTFRYLLKGDWNLGMEMGYWDFELNKIRSKGWIQEMFDEDVIPAIEYLHNRFGKQINVFELGPGPVSRLTEGWKNGLFELVAVDPLADEYKRNFRDSPFLVNGYGEYLDTMFEKNSFHMCYASNSLDHVNIPSKCMKNLFYLTKVDGLIMIQGNVREGERTGWIGCHNYNLFLDGNKLMCEEKSGRVYDLTEGLDMEKIFERHRTWSDPQNESVEWFSITYRRVA